MDQQARYLEPSRSAVWFNAVVARMTKLGVSLWGSRVLSVRGRTSGQWRSVPVNVLTIDGERYLVAARGHTQWVRNLRAAGAGTLRVGRRVEGFRATELADVDKSPVVRAYLARWAWEVGAFFDGINARSSEDELRAAAPGIPVFRIEPA
ncbi:nitroreductase/quinone reductase family protein [Prauserella rugosa]|uniref:nitroreductase/quinone reductase family protein n=1 Tax=Prauserella rugosa TaxID=43354 RepID=UPI0004C3EDBF|nr:nitroreductase/quinone reductase family protein [Prauserella rugosa]KMS91996.1 hypothetical protein ACZ91_06760 [Streptomyces regensis]